MKWCPLCSHSSTVHSPQFPKQSNSLVRESGWPHRTNPAYWQYCNHGQCRRVRNISYLGLKKFNVFLSLFLLKRFNCFPRFCYHFTFVPTRHISSLHLRGARQRCNADFEFEESLRYSVCPILGYERDTGKGIILLY